ncbi:MAG: hypothetical protein FWC11_05960 [Firmicutes bacterium]|nr:hypothetical protein [Bacillota bacterium]MCL2256376.1 hypothetical protein [Bacillota bacterium]
MANIIENELNIKCLKYLDRQSKEEREVQAFWGGTLFDFDSEEIFEKSKESYQNLALIGAILSSNTYQHNEQHLHQTFEKLGVDVACDGNIKIFSDVSPLPLFAFAHARLKKDNKDNDEEVLVFVVVRGSDSKPEVIANIAGCFALGSANPREHLAHSAGKKLVMQKLEEYLESIEGICSEKTKFFVTGHSYGGAVSNLVAKKLEDVFFKKNIFCFTFGAPNNIIVSKDGRDVGSLDYIEKTDKNIHNIRDTLDPICLISDVMPFEKEVFTIFGVQHWFSSDARWFEHLPLFQLTSTSHHHFMANYIKFILSTMETESKQATPIRYNSLYALGTGALPKSILKLAKNLSTRKKK